jgi:Fe-S-cluster-containing dehydrogenase component
MHRVKEGKDPACVSVCPTHCMYFGDLDDPQSTVNQLLRSRTWHALLPDAGTRPRVYYLT